MYNVKETENRWQKAWSDQRAFSPADNDRPTFYVLDMFPYPSGKGLHVGHLKGYVASDVVARYKRAQGYEVLHPMGWDSFGLPTERQAQKENMSPAEITRRNISAFKEQLDAVGLSYDWSREIATSHPGYYRWTQWIFEKLYENGLAYRENKTVNWCPAMKTVLANEEVVDGKYVETGDPVERRNMKQWMLRITAYADRLLDDLDLVDWPEPIKRMQRNWIGRSEGASIHFEVMEAHEQIEVFTTRPDTLFGVTYLVLAPEHSIIDGLIQSEPQGELSNYVERARNRSDVDRKASEGEERTGVDTGLQAIHPATGEVIPIWTSDYVLGEYGTGAIMAVPAHDERDFEFANQFALPIRQVVKPNHGLELLPFTGVGTCIDSSSDSVSIDGLPTDEAKQTIVAWLQDSKRGSAQVNYKLRDWLFSRQRYWGEPFPVMYDSDGELALVGNENLPVKLPDIDLRQYDEFDDSIDSPVLPLDKSPKSWLHPTDHNGIQYTRETNTMPQWAGSCWYYLRFIDPRNEKSLCETNLENRWMPVDLYVGGAEHATLHLLYARFWHKFLYDIGVVTTIEPFKKLFNQGMIHSMSYRDKQGRYYYPNEVEEVDDLVWRLKSTGEPINAQIEKMSKSKCNGLPPEVVIEEYGSDALRLYEVFMGPIEDGGLWDSSGIKGVRRFLDRLWRLFEERHVPDATMPRELERAIHIAVRDVTNDIESLSLNTAVSRFMTLVNVAAEYKEIPNIFFRTMAQILAPFAPHFAEELWNKLGESEFVFTHKWPEYNDALCMSETVTIGVQINGKTRGTIDVTTSMDEEAALDAARRAIPQLASNVEPKKVIYIPGRILNVVIQP